MAEDAATPIRERITYAAALLAIVLSITPAYAWSKEYSVEFLGDPFSLSYGYLAFVGLLGLAVYLYAISLVIDFRLQILSRTATSSFALALAMPVLFPLLYLLAVLLNWAFPTESQQSLLSDVIVVLFAIGGGYASYVAQKRVAARDKERLTGLMSRREDDLLTKARQLMDQGFYDSAVVQASNALVAAAKTAMASAGELGPSTSISEVYKWLRRQPTLDKLGIEAELETIRKIRNSAAHGELEITHKQAEDAIARVAVLIGALPRTLSDWEVNIRHFLKKNGGK